MNIKRILIYTLAFTLTAVQPINGATRAAPTPPPAQQTGGDMTAEEENNLLEAAQEMRRAGLVQFNFKDMDLVRFMRFMSELLQENIIVPPNVNAKITIISPHPVTVRESREIMLSTLQMYNFSLQNMGSYSIVRQGGTSPSPEVHRGRSGPSFGEETVTYIVPLDYITVESIIPAIQQTFGPALIVMPVGNGRDILLQGRATDVRKGMELIRRMDTSQSARITRTFELQYGDPAVVAGQINATAGAGGPLQGLSAVADPSSKKIIVIGSSSAVDKAARLIKDLDVDSKIGDFHIYKLKNIDATAASEQVAKVLASSATMLGSDASKFPATVVPDVATNSLIFAATQRQFDSLVPILDAIDVHPKQILLRGFIAEINVTNLENQGIDWNVVGGMMFDDLLIGGNMSLGESTVPSTFMQWFNDLSKREELLERGGSTYSVTNYNPMALMYATINMLKKYIAINVLSVPRLMCTDNKESSFQVGQVIPMLKGSTSDLSNPSAVQSNFDYKDTGLILTVTPHIRSGNLVAMDIKQTMEDVLTAVGDPTPRTSKREVNTSVVVGDGETIILGGMIREAERSLSKRVPGLSYIPLIGGLFKSVSKEKEKIDFIIFLTPQIIETKEEMREATLKASGYGSQYIISGDLGFSAIMPDNARQELLNVDVSPFEADIDMRFRELYKKSLKRR